MSAPTEEPVQAQEAPAVEITEEIVQTEPATEEAKTEEEKPVETETKVEVKEDAAPVAEAKAEVKPEIIKTTAQINDKDYRKNRRFDAKTLPESNDPALMRHQVEFYFGDANLPEDEHLWNLTGGPENKPVELKHIASFSRMRRFKDYAALVNALKESEKLEVTGDEGKEMIARKKAYVPRGDRGGIMNRSVYVKGFGDEEPTTQFDLEAFFSKLGDVDCVRLRRTDEQLFKGSVFVEFRDEAAAAAFLALDPAPKWKDHDLKIMSKRAYVDEKNRAIKAGEIEPNRSKERKFFEGRGGKGGKGGKGGRGDKDDWKTRRDNDRKNGFRDGGRGGRGGRGRGRGGRGGRGDRRGGGDRDRNEERRSERNGTQPQIKATNEKGEVVADKPAAANDNGKRPREDAGDAGEPQAKKVDTKTEA